MKLNSVFFYLSVSTWQLLHKISNILNEFSRQNETHRNKRCEQGFFFFHVCVALSPFQEKKKMQLYNMFQKDTRVKKKYSKLNSVSSANFHFPWIQIGQCPYTFFLFQQTILPRNTAVTLTLYNWSAQTAHWSPSPVLTMGSITTAQTAAPLISPVTVLRWWQMWSRLNGLLSKPSVITEHRVNTRTQAHFWSPVIRRTMLSTSWSTLTALEVNLFGIKLISFYIF